MTKIVILSDTHNKHRYLGGPDGDILIHAGDFTSMGTLDEISSFLHWLDQLPHAVKVIVPGNHDFMFQTDMELIYRLLLYGLKDGARIKVLINDSLIVNSIRFWGSPYSPPFKDWAFNKTEEELEKLWQCIPLKTEVLITHGPPYGILDEGTDKVKCGSTSLLEAVKRIQPAHHIFGHIHKSYGTATRRFENHLVRFYNASVCDENYSLKNQPMILEVRDDKSSNY